METLYTQQSAYGGIRNNIVRGNKFLEDFALRPLKTFKVPHNSYLELTSVLKSILDHVLTHKIQSK